MEIHARNVNDALSTALIRLHAQHQTRSSRNGPVIAFAEPMTTIYSHPGERVLFSPKRNANPVFHMMEALWMLAGRNDVKFPAMFVKRMEEFSDNGILLHGAYGYRWRKHFGYDQLDWIALELAGNPESRRCNLQMWDGGQFDDNTDGVVANSEQHIALEHSGDLYPATHGGKDIPCNTNIYFDCRDGRLNMTVCCRSNDVLWGCYGANAVHMSFLLEYMAGKIGVPVGVYRQMSNDLHLYTDVLPISDLLPLALDVDSANRYTPVPPDINNDPIIPLPLLAKHETIADFDDDLETFFLMWEHNTTNHGHNPGDAQYSTDFFNFTVAPMYRTWEYRKAKSDEWKTHAADIEAPDWRRATTEWVRRNRK